MSECKKEAAKAMASAKKRVSKVRGKLGPGEALDARLATIEEDRRRVKE